LISDDDDYLLGGDVLFVEKNLSKKKGHEVNAEKPQYTQYDP